MKILSVDLSKLIYFKSISVSRLQIDFVKNIVLCLGNNGCGKSSLMRQLTPFPPVRSDYEPGGYKVLVIDHAGSIYTLKNDFSNKTSPHSFVKDDVELNDGGTTDVQVELVATHLGLTPPMREILNNEIDFCKMPAGVRRTLLIKSNPASLGFILDHHKRVSAKIRACKANVTMLQDRKIQLESKFLDKDTLDALRVENTDLNDTVGSIIGYIGLVKGALNHYDTSDHAASITDYTRKIKAFRREVTPRLGSWMTLDKTTSIDQMLAECQAQIRQIQDQVGPVHDELVELNRELNGYRERMQEMTDGEAVTEIALRIQALKAELDELERQKTEEPISVSEIVDAEHGLRELDGVLQAFMNCSVRLVSQKVYHLKQHKWRRSRDVLHQLHREREQICRRLTHLEMSQKIRLVDIPDQPCAKLRCPLYVNFKNAYDEVRQEISHHEKRLRVIDHKLMWGERYVEGQGQQLEALDVYQPHLITLHELIARLPCYRSFFKSKTILKMLETNPIVIYKRIEDHVYRSKAAHRIRAIESLLIAQELLLGKNRHVADTERDRLKDLIVMRERRTGVLSKQLASIEAKRTTAVSHFNTVESYAKITKTLKAFQEEGCQMLDTHRQVEEQRLLEDLLKHLQRCQMEAVERLGQINSTIREQEFLDVRYREEVINQLEVVEAEKKDWEDMERALSKLPHLHTVSFINALIGTINAYVSKVFTYEFRMIPIDVDATLNYEFSVVAGDTVVPDISGCSDGQREMINVAFSLALQKLLKLTDYPVYLDEIGRSFNTTHKQRLLDLLRHVLEDHLVSQMFLINHHAQIHEGLANAQTIVLDETNIMTPVSFNEHVKFNEMV